MLAVESIDAIFDHDVLRPGSFRAQGELRVVQLAEHESAHGFTVSLESVGNVRDIQPNRTMTRPTEAGNGSTPRPNTYQVRIPARTGPEAFKPLALLRYTSAVDYAPIPLKVMPRWAFAEGIDRLELRVAAHPKIKGGLHDVRIVIVMGGEISACRAEPAGAWDAATRTLTWRVERLAAGSAPLPFKADFKTSGQPKDGRTGRPFTAHFNCDMCNLTGLKPQPAAGAPIGKVLSRFVSGKYLVNCGDEASC